MGGVVYFAANKQDVLRCVGFQGVMQWKWDLALLFI